MAGRGRPKVPTAVKKARGTDQPCRTNENEPVPIGKLGPPPDDLKGRSLDVWEEVRRTCWWLGDSDRLAVRQLCLHEQIWTEAFARMQNEEIPGVQVYESGAQNKSGAFQVMDSAFDHMKKLMDELGMTATSRSKIDTGKKPEKSAWDQFKEG